MTKTEEMAENTVETREDDGDEDKQKVYEVAYQYMIQGEHPIPITPSVFEAEVKVNVKTTFPNGSKKKKKKGRGRHRRRR